MPLSADPAFPLHSLDNDSSQPLQHSRGVEQPTRSYKEAHRPGPPAGANRPTHSLPRPRLCGAARAGNSNAVGGDDIFQASQTRLNLCTEITNVRVRNIEMFEFS